VTKDKSDPGNSAPNRTYWLVAIIALVWFTMGSANFVFQMTPGAIDAYPPAEQAMIAGRPGWATVAFAVSVLGGLLGSISLLMRRVIVEKFMLASLLGSMIATGHTLTLGINPGIGVMIMTTVLPIGLGILFFWFTNVSKEKGWLR